MVKNTAISSVANTIKQFHIWKNMHMTYKQDFYKDKKPKIDEFCIEYLVPIIDNIDHPTLNGAWKQNLDAAAYEKKPRCKYTIN